MLWHLFIHELLKLTKDSEGINKDHVPCVWPQGTWEWMNIQGVVMERPYSN